MTDISMDNKVIVRIFGEEYPMAAGDDAAHISKVADFVDSRMKAVAGRSRSQARDKVAILAAMSLASELIESKKIVDASDNNYASSFDRLLARLDEVCPDS